MRITKIKIRNLFGIKEYEQDGKSVELAGSNGVGKTSVIDAIRYALTNKENTLNDLSPELKAVIIVDKRITKVEKKVEHLEHDMPLYGAEADELCSHVKRRGSAILGGKQSNAYKDSKIRSAVYTDIYNQIKREFGLYDENGRYKSYKALKRRYLYEAHELIDTYELPKYLQERVNDCNAQMSMEVA